MVHRSINLNCTDWSRIVFSDVFHFQMCPYDKRRRVLRRSGQRGDPALSIARQTDLQQGVMSEIPSPLIVISVTLTAE